MLDVDDRKALDAALALLSLITGDEWDAKKLVAQSEQMRELAIHTLRTRGLTEADAKTFVDDRWRLFAADIPDAPNDSGAPVVESSLGTNPEADLTAIPTPEELDARLADYRWRKYGTPPS